MLNLKIENSLHQDDKTGRLIIRYTPVLTLASSEPGVRFPCWEAYVGEPPEVHAKATSYALENARVTLSHFCNHHATPSAS